MSDTFLQTALFQSHNKNLESCQVRGGKPNCKNPVTAENTSLRKKKGDSGRKRDKRDVNYTVGCWLSEWKRVGPLRRLMPLIMGCDTAWHPAISNVTHKCTHTQTQMHTHSKARVLGAAHAGTFYICIFIIIIIISSSRLNSDMRSGCCMKCLSQEMKTISSSFFVFTPYASKGWCIKSKYMQHTRGNRLISALKRIWIVKG